jgi:hypothetical protein
MRSSSLRIGRMGPDWVADASLPRSSMASRLALSYTRLEAARRPFQIHGGERKNVQSRWRLSLAFQVTNCLTHGFCFGPAPLNIANRIIG